MTELQFDEWCASMQLAKPVTLADAQEVYADLKPKIAAGLMLDVRTVSDDAIEILVGRPDPDPKRQCKRTLRAS